MSDKQGMDSGAWRAVLNGALNDPSHPRFKTAEWIIMVCTVVSVLVTIVSTVPRFASFHTLFLCIEVACGLLFMAEYFARLALSKDRMAYAFSLWGFVDLMSFLPILFVLVPLSAVIFAQQLKILLVFRSLRVAKEPDAPEAEHQRESADHASNGGVNEASSRGEKERGDEEDCHDRPAFAGDDG